MNKAPVRCTECDCEQLRAENARLRRHLADCIVWMDTREEAQPGMPRLCDMARAALSADPAPVGDEWQPIETAPHETPVLLYCPDRGCPSNRERIELGCYSTGERVGHTSTMSYHSWATHWMPLPPPPSGENGND